MERTKSKVLVLRLTEPLFWDSDTSKFPKAPDRFGFEFQDCFALHPVLGEVRVESWRQELSDIIFVVDMLHPYITPNL